jgi:succinyl-CoA synthetase beta subunit
LVGLTAYKARQIAFALFDDPKHIKAAQPIFKKLYKMFVDYDCSLAEINPLIIDGNDELLAIDSKVTFDDNALIKHPQLEDLRDLDEEDLDELDAKNTGLSFIKLDGNIGCIVNGAGLAMATMDMVKLFGGEPANFLDVGGSSNPDKIIKAFELILKNKSIKSVLINIFGGITRCDDIANGLVKAKAALDINVPIVIRLTGTNEDEAKQILIDEKLDGYSTMQEAVEKVIALAKA